MDLDSGGCAVLFTALRLRWPTVAVLASAMQFGWWPASGTAVAVTAFEIARFSSSRRRTAVLTVAADDPFARSAARRVESRPPPRSTCLYERDRDGIHRAAVLRYCFQHDLLISKDRFEIGTAR